MTTTIKSLPTDPDDGARAMLRKVLKPGSVVYACMRYRSPNGLTRRFSLFIISKDHRKKLTIRDISYLAAEATGFYYDKPHEAIRVRGFGMDMGFHCVYSLGRALFPTGFKVPKGGHARNGDTSGFDADGGYALEHRSL